LVTPHPNYFFSILLVGNNSRERILNEITADIPTPTTIFTTFGTGNSYSLNTSFVIGAGIGSSGIPPAPPVQQSVAAAFIPTETLFLNTVQIAVSYQGGPNELTVYVASGQTQPEQPLETFTFTNVSGGPLTPVILTATSTLHPELKIANRFWVVVTTQNLGNSWFGWQFSSPVVSGTSGSNIANGPWNVLNCCVLPAFLVTGIP
jgi:hypothetical protein